MEPRREIVPAARGKPSMMQLMIQPAYGLTIHKIQAMTIIDDVNGCLEGIFALGHVYVLVSRVTDPELFQGVGLPPADMLDAVARAWAKAGLDVDECFAAAVKVTDEWEYTGASSGKDPCDNVRSRLKPKFVEERRVKLVLSSLREMLMPQREAAVVLHGVLEWMDRVDVAAQRGDARPDALRRDGKPLFPFSEWWLTEMEKRKPAERPGEVDGDGQLDEEDLTLQPAEAGYGSSTGSSDDEAASDASLPDGPPQKKKKCAPADSSHLRVAVSAGDGISFRVGGISTVKVPKTRIRGKRAVHPTSSQAVDARTNSPSATAKKLRIRGKQKIDTSLYPSDPAAASLGARDRCERSSLIPAIQLLESGCGQAAEAAVFQNYMEDAERLVASVSPSDPDSHPEAGSSSIPTVAGASLLSRSCGGAPTPQDPVRASQHIGPGIVSRLSQAFRPDAPCNVAMQSDPAQVDGDEQVSVGAASIVEMPADLRRRAKAGDGRIQVVEDSAASADNP